MLRLALPNESQSHEYVQAVYTELEKEAPAKAPKQDPRFQEVLFDLPDDEPDEPKELKRVGRRVRERSHTGALPAPPNEARNESSKQAASRLLSLTKVEV